MDQRRAVRKHGPVNKLRPMTGGYELHCTLAKRAYNLRTRGPHGPMFGDLAITEVKHADIANVMATQPGGSSGTRNHVHRGLSRIFSLAEIPLGLRPVGSNPVRTEYRASRDPDKRYSFLYPPEVLALLGNRRSPSGAASYTCCPSTSDGEGGR
jgi:hypothetical protein